MTAQDKPLCKNCRHCRVGFLDRLFGGFRFAKCDVTDDDDEPLSLVSGQGTAYCSIERAYGDTCGPEGKMFSPIGDPS